MSEKDIMTKIAKNTPQNTAEPSSEKDNTTPHSDDARASKRIPDKYIEKLRQIAREEVNKALAELQKPLISSESKYPMAPQPKLIGKKLENAKRVKLSVIIDEELAELIKVAARELNKPYSQVIDNALYYYFNQPILSFQKCSDPPKDVSKE